MTKFNKISFNEIFFCLFLEIGKKIHERQLQFYQEQETASVTNAVRKTTEIMKQEQMRVGFLLQFYKIIATFDFKVKLHAHDD